MNAEKLNIWDRLFNRYKKLLLDGENQIGIRLGFGMGNAYLIQNSKEIG